MQHPDLSPYLAGRLADATIAQLPNHYRGKVRDNYDLTGGRRVIIATDRLSAFDRILTVVPLKGQVLTQIARFWFEATQDIVPNHVLSYPDPNVLVGRRLDILPVEIVVRDYLAGTTSTSILPMYQAGRRDMYGVHFPDGLKPYQQLPETIVTPTSKAFDGGHDEPLSPAVILAHGLVAEAMWTSVVDRALKLFERGRSLAAERGLILADTKYEFGLDPTTGAVLLADEIHTPDSSRYWIADSYASRLAEGSPPESLDKDFVRSWVTKRCDPYRDPIPAIPDEIVLQAAALYLDLYERIVGRPLDLPPVGDATLERVRRNLEPFFEA